MTKRTGQSARTILLRRPAVLSIAEGVFVPEVGGDALEEVEHRWRRLCEENPAYYDGRLYHVLGVHRNGHGGAVLHVMDCAYRFHAVQDESFDVGVRPLGAKGLTIREGRVLMGRRANAVGSYQGLWEFAPGGVVEVGASPAGIVASELAEETGLATAREPTPIALLYDKVLRCWELAYRLVPGDGAPVPGPGEYDELRWCGTKDLPDDLTPIAMQMARLLPSALR